MKLDPTAVADWLTYLHGEHEGLIHVCAVGNWTGQACETVEQAVAYVEAMDRARKSGIYVRATTLKGPLDPHTRGSDSDSYSIPGLWADIDLEGPGHKHDPDKHEGRLLVPDEAGARELIAGSGLPEPTLWVCSGGGYYPWWMLPEPHVIGDDLPYIRALSENWHRIIEQAARERGWHYGTQVSDLSRVLRIPGTVNRKILDTPTMCRIVSGGGDRYSLTNLNGYIQACQLKPPKPAPNPPYQHEPVGHPIPPVAGTSTTLPSTGERPGDALEDEPWDSQLLLGGTGWQVHHTIGSVTYWTRPGKNPREGHSASTGMAADRDRMWVFTDATELPPNEPLTKLGVYTHLHHGGDFREAARALRDLGFGLPAPEPVAQPDPWIFEDSPSGPVVVPIAWRRFEWDDLGNGERFAVRYQHQVRFTEHEQWLSWDGRRWCEKGGILVEELAGFLVRDLARLEADFYSPETPEDAKESERDKFLKWIGKQGSDARVRAMVARGRVQRLIRARTNDFDTQQMLLNCHNGVLDLATGELSPHDQSKLMRRITDVSFDPSAHCPLWDKFLGEVVPDLELRAYLRRVIGYSLTGETGEQVLFTHLGTGANGKGTFKQVLSKLFGDYYLVMSPMVLLADKNGRAGEDGKLAAITSRRFLEASESGRGRRWDEEAVKRITGEDTITARHMYQEDFQFRPVGKVHLFTNELPHVSITDSMWRRLRVFPWEVSIPEEERDKKLAHKLEEELPGILNWALQGCLDWQRYGLAPPPKAVESLGKYKSNEDILADFIETALEPTVDTYLEPSSTIYQAYRTWADRMGLKPMSQPALSRTLEDRGMQLARTKKVRGFRGVRVTNPGPNWISGAHPWTGP